MYALSHVVDWFLSSSAARSVLLVRSRHGLPWSGVHAVQALDAYRRRPFTSIVAVRKGKASRSEWSRLAQDSFGQPDRPPQTVRIRIILLHVCTGVNIFHERKLDIFRSSNAERLEFAEECMSKILDSADKPLTVNPSHIFACEICDGFMFVFRREVDGGRSRRNRGRRWQCVLKSREQLDAKTLQNSSVIFPCIR